MQFPSYSHFGIWSAKNASFVCLEPWCGVADLESHNKKLEEKEGVITLAPQKTWTAFWNITLKA
ncbi:hypothetical protein K5I29_05115 [Flavobacterium agricola]|uniref:Aldose 1-epimerase n=1 Tax=Flavobacterium agricola TaxID=2870839 RepID=A0ABY6M157_9FLAO|nr:hypothetical protein [Flavobacterium agricola]UYW02283.1 hypothetical protein K5I29_05115 [Flavobacterium agricola]